MNVGVVLFIVAILVVVMIHEAGHFLTAKLFNFKATQFFVGFGPTVWSFKKGETEYGIKALPLGGFVKILGMNPYEEISPEDEHRSYPNKPAWQRAIVLLAGSATHWVVAFVLLVVASMTIGFPTGREHRDRPDSGDSAPWAPRCRNGSGQGGHSAWRPHRRGRWPTRGLLVGRPKIHPFSWGRSGHIHD